MRFIRSSVYVPRRSVVAFGPSSRLAHRRLPLRAFVLGGLAIMVLAFAGPSWSQTLLDADIAPLGTDIDGEAASDQSGWSVSLSSDGTRVAIGARFNDANGSNSGHVRVYDWNGTAWTQVGADIDGEAADDFSGYSLSLSSDGTRVAIGAVGNDGANGSNSGHVRVYELNGNTWTQLGTDIDGEAAYDQSGHSVSLSSDGTRVAIGARFNDANGIAGQVRIYEYNGTAWTQLGTDIDGEAVGDESGHSVSLSSDGTRVAIGAIGNGNYSGHVRVYAYAEGRGVNNWTQLGTDIDSEAAYDESGYSVSLSSDGTRVAIGAIGNGNYSGHVRVYDWNGSAWIKVGDDIDGEAASDQSGYSVSLSSDGTRVAIGARGNDDNGSDSGHVRVYDWNGSAWIKVGDDIDGEAVGDNSGWSVSLSSDGTRVAIGARLNDANGSNSGHVRVYSLLIGTDIDGEAAIDQSGWSVSLSSDGTRVAIGANRNDGNSGNGGAYGHVRVYALSGGSRIQLGTDIDGEAVGDELGWSVSLSSDGTRVAIGAPGSDSGHVRVYELNGNTWTQLGTDIDGEAADDQSGWSVSLSSDGTRVAIGANGNGNYSGHVRVYDYNGTAWTQLGTDIDGEAVGDESGHSVSLSSDGTRVAIGAPWNDANGNSSGHVRVYDWNGSAWIKVGDDIDGEAASDQSGYSVSLSSDGTRVAIGAYFNDGANGSNSGHVRVYELNGNTWTQLGTDIDGEAAYDQSGHSVSLSSDGTRVAIGAVGNDGANGSNSGHVRVYDYNGTAWTQLGTDIDGEAASDQSGHSVSLSSDGSRVAIGAYFNDGANGSSSGHVRVYSLPTTDSDGDGILDPADNYDLAVTEKTDGSRRLTTVPASGSSTCSLATFSVDNNVATSKAGIAADGVGMAADFTLTGCNPITAESVVVSIDMGAALPNGATAYKIKPDGEWLAIEGATIAGNVVTYTLLDNGPYDLNTTLGEIRDPVTVAVSAPSSSSSSSSSSGASSGSGARPVPSLPFFGLLLMSGLLGVLGLRRLKA